MEVEIRFWVQKLIFNHAILNFKVKSWELIDVMNYISKISDPVLRYFKKNDNKDNKFRTENVEPLQGVTENKEHQH